MFPALYGALSDAHERGSAAVADVEAGWPAIILRTPKGWTGPDVVDGVQVQGTFRAHQVPLSGLAENPEHLRMLEEWLRSYSPETLFDESGRLVPELGPSRPSATSGCPRRRTRTAALREALPPVDLAPYEVAFEGRGRSLVGNTVSSGELMRDLYAATDTFRLFSPDETASNRLQAVFEVTDRAFMGPVLETDDHLSADGRVMEVLSEHLCQGWLEGYTLTGRHGVFATYEAFAMVSASMAVQHVKWLQHAQELPWRASVPSLNVLLTSTCWRNDHNGFSHQGPGLIDAMLPLSPGVVRVWLPPDANTTLSVMDHCLRSQRPRQPDRGRQAAPPAVPHPRGGAPPQRGRRGDLGVGRRRAPRTRVPTSCWRARATYRPRRRWPRPSCCATTCRTCACAS